MAYHPEERGKSLKKTQHNRWMMTLTTTAILHIHQHMLVCYRRKNIGKKNKKHQEVNLQEQSKNMNLERNFGRDGGKKKRKRKNKNKKVSVCS